MAFRALLIVAAFFLGLFPAFADDVLYRYEADVLPYDDSAGWRVYNPCEVYCTESLADGHFVLHWEEWGDMANYAYRIAEPPTPPPPPTLWIEWRFRSSQVRPAHLYGCDGRLSIDYIRTEEVVFMHGDCAVSFSGDIVVTWPDVEEFHTFRFESLDGVNYWISVDGLVFITDAGNTADNGYSTIQFSGEGGCLPETKPTSNEWDFIRFGTISYGERIVASDPPAGLLDPQQHSKLNHFTVTFDSPNYVYLDEITVESTPLSRLGIGDCGLRIVGGGPPPLEVGEAMIVGESHHQAGRSGSARRGLEGMGKRGIPLRVARIPNPQSPISQSPSDSHPSPGQRRSRDGRDRSGPPASHERHHPFHL